MASSPFGFGPPAYLPRRSVIDPITGLPVVTSAPTGETVKRSTVLPVGYDAEGRAHLAAPAPLAAAQDALNFVGDVAAGRKGIFDPATGHVSDEAVGKSFDLAGAAMTGSIPFSAPRGALRMFGGSASKEAADDPLAALEAALGAATKDMKPEVVPRSFVDPSAKSWDLYHGTSSPVDFSRFRTDLPSEMRSNTVGSPSQGQAVFLSPAPAEAAHYAFKRGATGEGVEAGPRTIRVSVDPGKTGLIDMIELAQRPGFADRVYEAQVASHGNPTDPSRLRSIRYAVDRMHQAALDSIANAKAFNAEYGHLGVSETPTYSYLGGGTDVAVQMAREQGLDTAVLRGLSESNGGDQVIALTPGRVRGHYSGDLLYSGAPVAFAMGGAALATPDAAQATPSQGSPPVTASPLGFGAVSPEDMIRLFGRLPLGAPQGLAPAPPVAETEADVRRLEGTAEPAPARSRPASPALRAGLVPLPPMRPPEISAPQADAPAEGAQPIMASSGAAPAPPAAPPADPDLLDRVMGGIRKSDGLLTSLGIGLMSTPGFGQGVAAGLQHHQSAQRSRATTDLAQAELDLKRRKIAQEDRGRNATHSYLLSKGFDEALATAARDNPTVLQSVLSQLNRDPSRVTIGGNIYELRPGERPTPANLLGPAEAEKDQQKLIDVPQPDGTTVKTWLKPGETAGVPIGAPERAGGSNVYAQVAERRKVAESLGWSPDSDQYKSYVATGKLPKEDQQSLTVTDKKAILEADESVSTARSTIGQLNRALDLSAKAYAGPFASTRGYVSSLWGNEAGVATQELDNQITAQALENLKAIFGSMPTEGERKILLEIQGASSQAPEVREAIYRRAIAAAERHLAFNQDRANQLRGGTFYKPQSAGAEAPALPSQPRQSVPPSGYSQPKSRADYDGLPSGARYIAPDGSVRVKP